METAMAHSAEIRTRGDANMGKNLKKAEPRGILKRTLAASVMLPVIAGLTACSSQETADTGYLGGGMV